MVGRIGSAACAAADAFFADAAVRALFPPPGGLPRFDVAVVDAGSLCGALLVDALHPLPYVHYLSYPYRPPASLKEHALEMFFKKFRARAHVTTTLYLLVRDAATSRTKTI